VASADSPRHGKDLSDSRSTEEVQAILPVQVDMGNLVSGFNDHIEEMRENMTNLDEKLEIVKANEARVEKENERLIERVKASKENEARVEEENVRLTERLKASEGNEARVEEENARLIEQLKVSEENEAKARNAFEAKARNSISPTAGFTWKAILGGCVNSSDADDWTLLLHNRNIFKIFSKDRHSRNFWGRVYDFYPFHVLWKQYKKGFVYQHSLKEPSDAYWYGLERMHRRTSVGRWQLVLSYICRNEDEKRRDSVWTAEKSYNVCISYDNFRVGGEDSFYDFHIGSELNRWGSDGKGWDFAGYWGSLKYINGTRFRTWDKYKEDHGPEEPEREDKTWEECLNCNHRLWGRDCYGGFWYNPKRCQWSLHPTGMKLNLYNDTKGDMNQCEHVFMAMKKMK